MPGVTATHVYLTVRDALKVVLRERYPKYPIIQAKQNSPEPNESYMTIFIDEFHAITGWDTDGEYSDDGLDVDFKHRERQMCRVELNFFKLLSQEVAEDIRLGLRRPSAIWALDDGGISLTDASPIRNFTAVIGQGFEYRGQMDLFVNFVQSDEYSIERIRSVSGTGILDVNGKEYTEDFGVGVYVEPTNE